jgi:protein-S-isoprenylcysteine O-methyltransferase Ste14
MRERIMERATDAAGGAEPAGRPDVADDDIPGIIAPGPLIAFGALLLGLAFDRLNLPRVINQVPSTIRDVVALILVSWGLWYNLRANLVFRRTNTPFLPWQPSRVVAAKDIYARTRNPMYQGFFLIVLGIAVVFRIDGAVLMLIPAGLLLHYGVVLREERYLARRFGDSYRHYMSTVPRYGWAFPGFVKARSKP